MGGEWVERVETCRGRNEQRVRVEYAIIIDMVQLLRKYNSCDLGRIVIEVRACDARNTHTHARARAYAHAHIRAQQLITEYMFIRRRAL